MDCAFQEKISEYLDGMLEKEQAEELEAHLDDCPSCSAFLQDLVSLKSELNGLSAFKASGVRRTFMKGIREQKKVKLLKRVSCIAAAVLLMVALPTFIHFFNTNRNNAMLEASLGAASANPEQQSYDANNNEIELFFSDSANAGKTQKIYGFECSYTAESIDGKAESAPQDNAAEESPASSEGSFGYSDYDATVKYSIVVSGFDSHAQEIALRKGLIALSAPASSYILLTEDGTIPVNIFDALQLISSYELTAKMVFDPQVNSLESGRIQLVLE